MKIKSLSSHSYQTKLTNGQSRAGALLHLADESGGSGCGEIAPLPKWSSETLEEALQELDQKKQQILDIKWTSLNYLRELARLNLLPSVLFGLESALLSILKPLLRHVARVSALLMGSSEEILKQSQLRHSEGYTHAKLKVSNLTFDEAASIIHLLKDKFRLRLDANRAWNTKDSLRFFSQFSLDTFDYVEEPFKNPKELELFPHPLAVDESFPHDLSLPELEALPALKALIYKPTIQGGMLGCLPLYEWTKIKGIDLVLSSSFESDVGLISIASIAKRLSLEAPLGIGTYHYLTEHYGVPSILFSGTNASIPARCDFARNS